MPDVDRYPTWLLLAAAVGAAALVIVRYMQLDRGANPRGTWVKLLVAWLGVTAVAALGLLTTRTGQRITPNEGLLVLIDIMAGLLVVSIPIGRALRRLRDSELRQIRGANALTTLLGRRGSVAVIAAMIGTIGVLLAGEIALAGRLPGPPAVVACQDYDTWITAPANSRMPPAADQGILNDASEVAPPGPLRLNLSALVADLRAAVFDRGTMQGLLDDSRILSDESAVNDACRSVPAAG